MNSTGSDWGDSVSFRTVELERMTYAIGQIISEQLAQEFALPSRVESVGRMLGNIALHVRQDIFAQHLERATVRYPATWRDAVKEALYRFLAEGPWPNAGHWPWFADYAAKRWPVWYQTVQIDVKALYPKVALPRQPHYVTVLREEWRNDEV